MKKAGKFILTGMCVLAFAACPLADSAQSYPTPPGYVNPVAPEFPIIGYDAFYDTARMTVENYRIMHDAGFNISLSYVPGEETDRMVSMCSKAGIKVMPWAPAIEDSLPYCNPKTHKFTTSTVIGYNITDEPGANKFASLRETVDYFRSHTPANSLQYITLLPNYANTKQLGTPTYAEYVSSYIKTVNPQFVAYDNYGIVKEKGDTVYRNEYFENFEIVSSICREAHVPMWTFCLSSAHYDYPVPTKGQMSVQVFSGLAYGAQGLCYYGYGSELNAYPLYITAAPLTMTGARTPIWYMISEINHEVQALASVFLGCEVKSVRHTGQKIPSGTTRLSQSDLPAAVSSLESEGTGVIVSQFSNYGKNYMLIVNRDFKASQRVNLTKSSKVRRINSRGQQVRDTGRSIMLEPGGWYLLTWK